MKGINIMYSIDETRSRVEAVSIILNKDEAQALCEFIDATMAGTPVSKRNKGYKVARYLADTLPVYN